MNDRIIKPTLLGYVILHLALVTLSASYIKIPNWVPGKSMIDFYLKATGADSNYGFFSPSIGKKTRALFDIVDQNGKKLTNISLVPKAGREVQIRLGGIFEEFTSKGADDPHFRQPLAASLAAAIFSQRADAALVILHVEEFRPKTMEEYRQGQRARWSEYYAARFARLLGQDKGVQ